MKKDKFLFYIGWLLAAVLIFTGCNTNTINVLDITCHLKINGEVLEGVLVTLNPVETSGEQRAASGMTEKDGSCRFITPGTAKPGVMPGEYIVTFSKYIFVGADGKPVEETPYDPVKSSPDVIKKYIIPEQFEDVQQSLHKITVESGKKRQTFDLNIEFPVTR